VIFVVVKIDINKCEKIDICEVKAQCIDVCPENALVRGDDYPEVVDSACNDCGICVPVCPVQALSI
jgi:Fe-S-cluster-containing hydrogenase component 2